VPGTRRWWCLSAVVLAITSATALTALGSITVMPSVFRNPLSGFVEPGVAVWWLVLGGPFRSIPASASGIAFAAAANAALWLVALWLAVVTVRTLGRMLTAPPS
jgi:hypothetical protein